MCAQRLLRSGPSAEVIKGPRDPGRDARQGVLDLDPGSTSAEQLIFRLAYENAQLTSRLTRAGLSTVIEDPNNSTGDVSHDRDSEIDPIAKLAASFAAQVVQLSSIPTDQPNDQDADKVNASIEMIAGEADALVTAVINDAEAHGLQASGRWLDIPLVEVQAFEVSTPDPSTAEADDTHDKKLNP
jgi:hypothetical protein